MTNVYLNQIATATPTHDVHASFVDYAPTLISEPQQQQLYKRMAARSQIEHRYSCLSIGDALNTNGFYHKGSFPSTRQRMEAYKAHAFPLVCRAIDQLEQPISDITHIIVTSCTGFYAPGIDLEIVNHYNLPGSVERTMIGFMGCYAAINALKAAFHIVRSTPSARVLIVNIELCTLHLQDNDRLDELLSFTLFADGCAASIVSAKPEGMKLLSFWSAIMPESNDQITWTIGDLGFDMLLSGKVPQQIVKALPGAVPSLLNGMPADDIKLWAVHPGGRTILDAVERGLQLPRDMLAISRDILRRYGNMSSATIMFVLQAMLQGGPAGKGCAMAFGPGVTMETMTFDKLET